MFAEHGPQTSIEVVARRAGVGLGTIYRRFADKQELVDELARGLLADAVAIAERHVDDPDGTGLFGYLWEVSALLATNRGFVSRVWNVPGAAVLVTRSRQLQGKLLASAQAHGLVRAELTARDIAVAL